VTCRSGRDPIEQHALATLCPSKLEPFRSTDMANGIYADDSDPLGRVWYHIPNLGPKFCDAVRKYSVVASFREANVIARKKSKDSDCMWVGIVGDPGDYTTGSKRHIIEFMCRNPGIAIDHTTNRRSHARSRTNKIMNPLKKRRRKRRRVVLPGTKCSTSGLLILTDDRPSTQTGPSVSSESLSEISSSDGEKDEESSLSSGTPSMLNMDRQASGTFGFHERDALVSPQSAVYTHIKPSGSRLKRFAIPQPLSTQLSGRPTDWLDTIHTGPHFFMLRDPQLPSPESSKTTGKPRAHPVLLSPEIKAISAFRRYTVEDLNQLLHSSESEVI
jgi:hypothetical protein